MKIDNLKMLQKVIAFCRKQNVTSIKIDGIELTISLQSRTEKRPKGRDLSLDLDIPEANIPVPQFQGSSQPIVKDKDFTQGEIETPDELSEEQLMMWSAQGQNETM